MELPKPPIVILVFISSFLAAPLIFTLDKLAVMQDGKWVFASGVITLPLFGLLCTIFVRDSPDKKEPLFYVWSIFSFTAIVDLFIALELDGYVKGFMEFYLREGEPYLRSAYGTMINWWDGTGHFSMYLGMIYLLCAGRDFRILGLYWVGSITHSMIVFMPGNVIGNKGLKWSYFLNVPYVFFPIYAGVRFVREGMKIKHKQSKTGFLEVEPQEPLMQGVSVGDYLLCQYAANKRKMQYVGEVSSRKKNWEKAVEFLFGVWFVAAIVIALFRYIACMGCKEKITQYYVTAIEPFLNDTTQYGRTQALCYYYYFIPFYVAALCALIYPAQYWIKDWSIIHAGASIQAQLVFICCSLKWRTEPEFQVPDTVLARSIFWTVNLSLLIIPHLFAMYCNRMEIREYFSREVVPVVKSIQGEVKNSQESAKKLRTSPRNGPVTRQQKKLM